MVRDSLDQPKYAADVKSALPNSDRARTVVGWLIVPALIAVQFVDLRHAVLGRGRGLFSIDVVLYLGLFLAGLPWSLRAFKRLEKRVKWIISAFVALGLLALISVLVLSPTSVYFLSYSTGTPVALELHPGRAIMLMPAVMALLALGAALSLIAAMPARLRLLQLYVASWTLLVSTYASWPRRIEELRSLRLSPGMAGAAVIFTALMLTMSIFLACYLMGRWRVPSLVGAGLSLVGILLSGSRAGLICLVLFVVLLLLGMGRRRKFPRSVLWAFGGFAVLLATLVAVVPEARRLFSLADDLREMNLHASIYAFTQSWDSVLFGQGFGRIWPWYTYESLNLGFIPRVTTTWWGDALPHPHSTFLLAMSELGLLGLALLCVVAWLVIRLLSVARSWGRASYMVAAAIAAQLPAWLFDTYLFKNFPLAFWWWAVLFSVLGFGALRGTRAGAGDDSPAGNEDAETQPSADTAAS